MTATEILIGLFGGIIGASIISVIRWTTSKIGERQQYYTGLIKLFEQHNWNLLSHGLNSGLNITKEELEVAIVCYQHLNILLYAWYHENIIKKDQSIEAWRNWTKEIIESSKKVENQKFVKAYHRILAHGDLYPPKFVDWLKKEMDFSVKTFEI